MSDYTETDARVYAAIVLAVGDVTPAELFAHAASSGTVMSLMHAQAAAALDREGFDREAFAAQLRGGE